MKKLFIVIAAVLALISCKNPLFKVPAPSSTVTVSFGFDRGGARTVLPDLLAAVDTYEITLTSQDGFADITGLATKAVPVCTLTDVTAGTWNIAVTAKAGTVSVASGSLADQVVAAALDVTVPLTAVAPSGNGNLSFTVRMPANLGINYVGFALDPNDAGTPGTAVEGTLVADGGFLTAGFSQANLSAGVYGLIITFKTGGGAGIVATFRESVNIWGGLTSDKWIDASGTLVSYRDYTEADLLLNASLANLTVAGAQPGSLPFASGTYSYDIGNIFNTAAISFTATESLLSGTVSAQKISYSWNGGASRSVSSGQASKPLSLAGGTNTLLVTVLSAGGKASSNYTVTMNWTPVYTSSGGAQMVKVPSGTFQRDGTPANVSYVSSLLMGKYEVSQKQWRAAVSTTYPSGTTDSDVPIFGVTWYDMLEFCNFLSDSEGLDRVYTLESRNPETGYPLIGAAVIADWSKNGYRLPTDMEWMWAAMGGSIGAGTHTADIFTDGWNKEFAGDPNPGTAGDAIGNYAWYAANSGDGGGSVNPAVHPVGGLAPNELGFYDMSGNVWELCWDRTGPFPAGALVNYTGDPTALGRVGHGGSWDYSAAYATVTWRTSAGPAGSDTGFRIARNAQARYSVTYGANFADSGTVPDTQTKVQDLNLNLASNSGSLTRTGFIFAGWNTAIDGSGTGYAEGAAYSDNAALVLYARWINDSKAITAFDLTSPLASGTITGTNIELVVPYGTNVTALIPTITHTGVGISPASDTAQDFSSPVVYTVTAADTSTQVYTVTVATAAPSGYSVSIDQPYINMINRTSASFSFDGATAGTTYDYNFTSTGGGGPVTGSGTVTVPNQTIAGIDLSTLGDGTVSLSVTLAGGGKTGNPAGASALKDTIAPTIFISAPSVSVARSGTAVSYTVSYTDAASVSLTNGDVILTASGSASATSATGGAGLTWTVTFTALTGDGTVGFQIASGTAADTAGNLCPASAAATVFTVDNTAPVPSGTPTKITGPALYFNASEGSATFSVPINTSDPGDVLEFLLDGLPFSTPIVRTLTAGDIAGSFYNFTVTSAMLGGDGTKQLQGRKTDVVGNVGILGPTLSIEKDTVSPSIALGAPSSTIVNSSTPVSYPVTYIGATTINLIAAEVTITLTGSASGTASVINGTSPTPTVIISAATGDGTLRISISAGTAFDAAGNQCPASALAANFTVDNTAPACSDFVVNNLFPNTLLITIPTQITNATDLTGIAGYAIATSPSAGSFIDPLPGAYVAWGGGNLNPSATEINSIGNITYFRLYLKDSLGNIGWRDPITAVRYGYMIGETGPSGIGKVFFTSGGGLSGLEAAPANWYGGADPLASWKVTQDDTPGTLLSIGSGAANTGLMTPGTHPAADSCRAYAMGGGGWFLPSRDELIQLNLQKAIVGGFTPGRYWSSSQADAVNAYYQDFGTDAQGNNPKDAAYSVRPIKSF